MVQNSFKAAEVKQHISTLTQDIEDDQAKLDQLVATVMPGYTHLQRAQPVTFAHWCLAYVEMLARDESRLQDALKRLDVSPLGSRWQAFGSTMASTVT